MRNVGVELEGVDVRGAVLDGLVRQPHQLPFLLAVALGWVMGVCLGDQEMDPVEEPAGAVNTLLVP